MTMLSQIDGLNSMLDSASASDAAMVTPLQRVTWGELSQSRDGLIRSLCGYAQKQVGLRFVSDIASYAILFAMEALHCDLVLMDSGLSSEQSSALARSLGLAAVISPARGSTSAVVTERFETQTKGTGTATVTVLTSGSTGAPKPILHTWKSLCRPTRRTGRSEQRWLLTYRPHLYAGLQVFLQCMADHGTLYLPGDGSDASAICRFIAANDVEYISATPSYWRRLLLFSDPHLLGSVRPVQITLGGEVADQAVLDALRRQFPHTRIVHIYATSELGRCFSVTDGREGFPTRFLDAPSPDGVEMRVADDELVVRSANAAIGQIDRNVWIRTGDLVTIHGGRVLFKGRQSEVINVGGSKVHPVEIERVIRGVPGVEDVRVFATRSSLAGQLVACELVPSSSDAQAQVVESVQQTCTALLAPFQRPRLMKIVKRIELSAANKVVRGSSPCPQ